MNKKYNTHGVIGTVLFHVIVLLLLIFWAFKAEPQEEEGVLVNLGNVDTGFGQQDPSMSTPLPQPQPSEVAPPKVSVPEPTPTQSEESVETQDFDNEAPELAKEEEKENKETEQERLEREKQEQERIEQERIERERLEAEARERAEQERKAEAERKRIEEQKRIKEEAQRNISNAFGRSNSNSTSQGIAGGSGNQGAPGGSPNSNSYTGSGLGKSGTGFSLSGRSLNGTLPQPIYNVQEEGTVVIAITVDKSGKVTNAQYQLRGSTTQNEQLKQAAIKAALQAKFNSDVNAAAYQKGTITYHFQLN